MTTPVESNGKPRRKAPGRPKKAIRRSDIVMVRLTPTERYLIQERAKNAGLKPSEWFRKAARSAKVVQRFSTEESSWFRMLAGIANNLNQLTRLAHIAGLFSLGLKCQSILRQIEVLLDKISDHDR